MYEQTIEDLKAACELIGRFTIRAQSLEKRVSELINASCELKVSNHNLQSQVDTLKEENEELKEKLKMQDEFRKYLEDEEKVAL